MVLKHKAKPEFKHGRKVNSKNCLSNMFPNLAKEWDYTKNKITPDSVHGLANKKVWWKCANDHNWEQKVTNRATGTQKCPYCTGRITTKNKNIKTDYPDIFKEWDFAKNKSVDPLKIPSGSNKKVWWKCVNGHSWQATVYSRCKRGHGCSKCQIKIKQIKIIKEKKCLKDKYPEFFKELKRGKNNRNIKLEEIFSSSSKLLNWKCSTCNNYFDATPHYRVFHHKENECSHSVIIKGQKFFPCNSIDNKKPELKKVYDNEKNKPFTSAYVSIFDKEKRWFKCEFGHSYLQKPAAKTAVINHSKSINCLVCEGDIVTNENNLKFKNPRVASEWDYEKNKIRPEDIFYKNSKNYVWWKCKFNHSWKTNCYHRTISESDCPSCRLPSSLPEIRIYSEMLFLFPETRHRFKLEGNEFDIYLPEKRFVIEYDGWYFHKDDQRFKRDLQKNKFIKSKKLKLIRVREDGLKETGIKNEIFVSKTNLEKKDIDKIIIILKKNGVSNNKTLKYLKRKDFVNEKLYRKIQYFLPAPPYNESLSKHYPNIAEEFDKIKNQPLTSDLFTPKSSRKVWWCCKSCDYKWAATIANRTGRKSGCPDCARKHKTAHSKPSKKSIYYTYPETRNEWHNKKNTRDIKTVKPQSHVKYWWICRACKNEYYKSVSSWVHHNRKCDCLK